MSEVSKRYVADETFREVADLLFGGGSELIYKANPDGADLSTKAKKKPKETPEWQKNVALGTNTAGVVAGPAAIYAATKGRKTGGFPRDAMRSGKLGGKLKDAAHKLDAPGSKKAKIIAGVAGGTMVGLQGANMAGDAIASRMIAQEKKRKNVSKNLRPVSKSVQEIPESGAFPKSKGQLTQAVAMKGSEKVKAAHKKGSFKKLPEKVKTVREKVGKSFDVTWEGEISKLNSDKQQVFGWASIVEIDGQPVVDLQGDYIAIDEVEKSAYEYVHKSRKGGDMHLRDEVTGEAKVGSHMIESFVLTPEKKEVLGMPEETPTGWWVGYQVNDQELWEKVKKGERTGFSIHGRGQRSAL